MHVFETDASNATLNPLYIQKQKIDLKVHPLETLSYRWWIVRIVLFLIVPIVLLWVIPYHPLYVYIWMCFVLVTQTVILRSIIHDNDKMLKVLGVLVACCVVLSIFIPFVPDTVVRTEDRYIENNNYKTCEWYTKADLPICSDGFFLHQTRVLATPTTTLKGQSLERDGILKVMQMLDSFIDVIGSSDGATCIRAVLPLLCQSILSPCDASCEPSKLSSTWCSKHMTEQHW